MQPLVIITPIVVITLTFLSNKDKIDFGQATLAVTLALNLNGILTNIIKIIVGNYRCTHENNFIFIIVIVFIDLMDILILFQAVQDRITCRDAFQMVTFRI